MTIYLGPTEHIDHPENLLGSGQELRYRLRSLMEPQEEPQYVGRSVDSHASRLDAARRSTYCRG